MKQIKIAAMLACLTPIASYASEQMAYWNFGSSASNYTETVTAHDLFNSPYFQHLGGTIDSNGKDGAAYTDTEGAYYSDGQGAAWNSITSGSNWILSLNTRGWSDISIGWNHKAWPSSASSYSLDYSLDQGTWVNIVSGQSIQTNQTYQTVVQDLSAITALNNATDVRFRVTYSGVTGSAKFAVDNIEIIGTRNRQLAYWNFGSNAPNYTEVPTAWAAALNPFVIFSGGTMDSNGKDGVSYTDANSVFHALGQAAAWETTSGNAEWVVTLPTIKAQNMAIRWDQKSWPTADRKFNLEYRVLGGLWETIVSDVEVISDQNYYSYFQDLSSFPDIEGWVTVEFRVTYIGGSSKLAVDNIEVLTHYQPELIQTINNPDPSTYDYFGKSVAAGLNGEAVIGVPGDDLGASGAGSVSIVERVSGNTQIIQNPEPTTSDAFGEAVAVAPNGDIVVGAIRDSFGATYAGSVYVFDATTHNLKFTIRHPSPTNHHYFGGTLAVLPSGNIVVGSITSSSLNTVYVFDGTNGNLIHTINNPGAASDYFGSALATTTSGKIIIGARYNDNGASNAGRVYVYNGTSGVLELTIDNPTPATNDYFGTSVSATHTGRIIVGAYGDDAAGFDAGSAYVFESNGDLAATLPNPEPNSSDLFGFSVLATTSGDIAVTSLLNDHAVYNTGSVYLYDGFTCELESVIHNPEPSSYDNFGRGLAASPVGDLIVGALGSRDFIAYSGSVYLYHFSHNGEWSMATPGTQFKDIAWNYAMGYNFTPLFDGWVTALGGNFNGAKTVKLFERDTWTLLAETTASSANEFSYTEIPGVELTAGTNYTVATYLAGSGGSYSSISETSFPLRTPNLNIESSAHGITSSDPNALPTTVYTYTMLGQADLRYSYLRTIPNDNGIAWPATFPPAGVFDETYKREEGEFKFSFIGNVDKTLGETDAEALGNTVDAAVVASLSDTDWQVPIVQNNGFDYQILNPGGPTETAFFDLYFDTPESINYDNLVSYRIRQRFDDYDEWIDYLLGDTTEVDRIEFQAKTDRVDGPAPGFSTVLESRYRMDEVPFVASNMSTLIHPFQEGRDPFDGGEPRQPGIAIVDYFIPNILPEGTKLGYRPEVFIRSERRRQHLTMALPILNAEDPNEQLEAYIITVDTAYAYDAADMLEYMRNPIEVSMPHALGSVTEIEIEWEHNVQDLLDEAEINPPAGITVAEVIALRNAFIADQAKLLNVIQAEFTTGPVSLVPEVKSKFIQGVEIANESELRESVITVSAFNYNPAAPGAGEEAFTDNDDFEFLALTNTSATAIDMTEYEFTDGFDFDFSTATITTLPANGTLYVVANTAAFETRYGTGHPIAGQYSGRISNGGERIILEDGSGFEVVTFLYDDAPNTGTTTTRDDWPTAADGMGSYLKLQNPNLLPDLSDQGSWVLEADGSL